MPFYLAHVASAIFAGFVWFFARGSDLETLGGWFFAIIVGSLAIHTRRTAQYRVLKARRRTRHALLKRRIAILAPVGDSDCNRKVRIEGTVVFMDAMLRDEIVVRADSAVTTTSNLKSDLLALTPLESGESFSPLVEVGEMPVALWFVNEAYLSVRRGKPFARKLLRTNPTFSLGRATAFMVGERAQP